MTIKHFIERKFVEVSPLTAITSIENDLLNENYAAIIDNGKFLGIITPADYLKSPKTHVADCFQEKPIVDQNDSLESTLALMKKTNSTILPVFGDGKFCGVVKLMIISEYFNEYNKDLQTTIDKQTQSLKKALDQKSILLHEIHHRVKNNLQLISSLIGLQRYYITDNKVQDFLRDLENRIVSMKTIHEHLYKNDNFSDIFLNDYFMTLVTEISKSYQKSSEKIKIVINTGSTKTSLNMAVTCGLIVTEIISNSFKYAFENRTDGEISISTEKISDEVCRLTIGDNGIGLPDTIDFDNTNTLGIKIIRTLVRQLNGTMKIDTSNGTKYIIDILKPVGINIV